MTALACNSEDRLETKILRTLFNLLNREKADYCIVNNYEKLPDIIPSDVDIAISPRFFKDLNRIVGNVSREHGVEIIQKMWPGYQICTYLLSPLNIDARFRLQLDFFTDFSLRGYPCLITHEKLLRYRRPYRGFFILAPEVEAIFLFMRRVVKNDMSAAHVGKLRALYALERQAIEATMLEVMGREFWIVTQRLIETGDVMEFRAHVPAYRRALKAWARRNTGLGYRVKYGLSQLKRAFHRLNYPVGYCVALLGPDGSGKTTIANMALEMVSGSFHGGSVKYWRPHLLPAMGKLKFWNPSEEVSVNPRPHDHPNQSRLKSLVRFFYYLADYIIGYAVKVYWAKVRKHIIIFDRYYYDYLVDLHRYRFNVPRWLPRFFLFLVPAPDLTVYLDAEPEELARRKQELPLPELVRQVQEFQGAVKSIPGALQIRTNLPIPEIVGQIASNVLKGKSEQTRRILREYSR